MPPQTVALAMNSGVGGRTDVICSVMVSVKEEGDDDAYRMGMWMWVMLCDK